MDRAEEILKTWANPAASRRGFESIEQVVRGKTFFARYVDFRGGRAFTDALYRSYPSLRRLLPHPLKGVPFRLMAEGKTDLLHLEAAHRNFKVAGEFAHLRPRFLNFRGDNGDKELMATLERIARADIEELTIGLFDCDDSKFMEDKGLEPGGYRRIGDKVFAACLAPPTHLADKPFCIELLYKRSQLCATTGDSRRVFLRDEFDGLTGLSLDGEYQRSMPRARSLLVSDRVARVADGYSSLLTKSDFANFVNKMVSPFDAMDFDGFRPTFDLISAIVDLAHEP